MITKVPVRRLEDLQGLELRATGLSAKTLEALGAIPVAMPQSDAYESLAKGVVKGNLSVIEVLEGWRQAEVVEYVTFTPFLYNTLFFMTMNKDVWNSLPPNLQEIIRDVNEKFHEEVAIGLWDKQVESALKFAEEFDLELINLSDEEMAKWMVLVEPIQEEFVAEMEAKGLPGREALEVAKRLADKYNEGTKLVEKHGLEAEKKDLAALLSESMGKSAPLKVNNLAQNLLMNLVQSESPLLPLLHFTIPFRFMDENTYGEFIVDKDCSERRGDAKEAKNIFFTIKSDKYGNFEVDILARDNIIDLDIRCPDDLVAPIKEIRDKWKDIIEEQGYRLARYHVGVYQESQTILLRYPKLAYGKAGLDVKV